MSTSTSDFTIAFSIIGSSTFTGLGKPGISIELSCSCIFSVCVCWIEYHFLDEQLESYYADQKRSGLIFRAGGALSIFVASLGLFGLATYNIQRREKELGIRKVLGASGVNLFLLLSSSFAKQVGIAFLIATPLAWYLMNEWLKVFEYKISLHPGIFLFSGLIALLIAFSTISYRTFNATRRNPVNSLRQE